MNESTNASSQRHIGTGWISGTLSVALAMVGFLAVLCFHFPEYLTLPQAREFYPLSVMRGLLHVILVAAFLLGLTSVMLRHNKTLGLVGMAIVLVSALLGGSRVPVDVAMTARGNARLAHVLRAGFWSGCRQLRSDFLWFVS